MTYSKFLKKVDTYFDSESINIKNVADPEDAQDAVNKRSLPTREIQKDGINKLDNAEIFNFEGNVNITDEGNGKATINVPFGGNGAFGSGFIYQDSEPESATSSTSYQDKIDYTTPVLPIGTYRFAFCAEGRISNSSKKCKIRLVIDDVEYIYSSSQGIGQEGYRLVGGFVCIDFLSEATHSIKIQWCSTHSSKTAYIRRARIEGWRIS